MNTYKQIIFASIFFFNIPYIKAQLVNLRDGNGVLKPLMENEQEYIGTPYLSDQWNPVYIYIDSNSTAISIPQGKYNILKDELIILDEQAKPLAILNYKMRSFILETYDTQNQKRISYSFKNGFNNVESFSVISFFQVHYEGQKVKLLQKYSKSIKEEPSAYGGVSKTKRILDSEKWYIYKDNRGFNILKNKKSILNVLKDSNNQLKLESFIKSKKLKLKSTKDIIVLLEYYETITK